MEEVVKGTVKELAQRYGCELNIMVGFLDGINDINFFIVVYKTIYPVNTKVNPSIVLQTVTVSYGFPLQSKTLTYKSSAGVSAEVWL